MANQNQTKRALLGSVLAIVLCLAMLIGTTLAWFTDSASTNVSDIKSGTLDVALEMKDGDNWVSAEGTTLAWQKADNSAEVLWEPGCTYRLPELRVVNNGNLALKYKLVITGVEGDTGLLPAIDFTYGNGIDINAEVLLAPGAKTEGIIIEGNMKEEAGNTYQNLTLDGITITVLATQAAYEYDSDDYTYDELAEFPTVVVTTEDELQTALNESGIVVLNNNIVLTETLVVPEGAEVLLNMNGKTLSNTEDVWDTGANNWSFISVQGGKLTVSGKGTLQTKENDCYAVDVQDNGTLVIEDGTFVGNVHAVYVHDGNLTINGGTFSIQQTYPGSAKPYEFVINCLDANYDNGTATVSIKGGTYVNFNPAANGAEGDIGSTNFVAEGYMVVSETLEDGTVLYTVVPEA